MTGEAISAIWLTLQLGVVTTVLLLAVSAPLAWWLAFSRSALRLPVEVITTLPLVLPPTVLGFYLLLLLAPDTPVGRLWQQVTGTQLAFSFSALVIGSVLYSLPFVVQPLQAAFARVPAGLLQAAATLGANPADQFRSVVLPLCRRSFLVAASLGFAHTVGEFGVVLMIGGNIPGETKVLSVAIYDHVESLDYASAHQMSIILVAFAFLVLLSMFLANRRLERRSR